MSKELIKHISEKNFSESNKIFKKILGEKVDAALQAVTLAVAETIGEPVAEEELEELSKSTLGSYVKKAADQTAKKTGHNEYLLSKGHYRTKRDDETYNKNVKTIKKRKVGLDKAVNKMVRGDHS